jgi:rare lipoprotein A (peptidoglycan hydrolase)
MRAMLVATATTLAVAAYAAPDSMARCRTHKCWHRVSVRRHRDFPKHHPERYRSWYRSVASWYGPGFYGHGMACGGTLQTWTVGVANKTMACGTRLVMCAARCREVPVVDRGPYVAGRDFDLTAAARSAIGAPSVGTVRWRYQD